MMKKTGFGEKNRMDCLIIIDDVSGIAENIGTTVSMSSI